MMGSMSYGAGVEHVLMDMVAIRAGYNTRADTNELTGLHCGLGFMIRAITIDYAFVPYGDIGMSHIISIGMKY